MSLLLATTIMATTSFAAVPSPQAPQQLKVPTLAYDDHSIVLVWDAPEDTSAIVDYQIYQNGRLIGLASQNSDKHSPEIGRAHV